MSRGFQESFRTHIFVQKYWHINYTFINIWTHLKKGIKHHFFEPIQRTLIVDLTVSGRVFQNSCIFENIHLQTFGSGRCIPGCRNIRTNISPQFHAHSGHQITSGVTLDTFTSTSTVKSHHRYSPQQAVRQLPESCQLSLTGVWNWVNPVHKSVAGTVGMLGRYFVALGGARSPIAQFLHWWSDRAFTLHTDIIASRRQCTQTYTLLCSPLFLLVSGLVGLLFIFSLSFGRHR